MLRRAASGADLDKGRFGDLELLRWCCPLRVLPLGVMYSTRSSPVDRYVLATRYVSIQPTRERTTSRSQRPGTRASSNERRGVNRLASGSPVSWDQESANRFPILHRHFRQRAALTTWSVTSRERGSTGDHGVRSAQRDYRKADTLPRGDGGPATSPSRSCLVSDSSNPPRPALTGT